MMVVHRTESGRGHDMLDHKELVATASDRCHRAECDRYKYDPSYDTVLGDVVFLGLRPNIVVWCSVGQPVAHVNGNREE